MVPSTSIGLARLVDFDIKAGVHGLWVLGTTGRFDLQTDASWRTVAETAAKAARGSRPPGPERVGHGDRANHGAPGWATTFPTTTTAALPPWYLPMTPFEVIDYYHALADRLARPVVIYNAPWICNQLSFASLRRLAEHPRIVGCKDVTPSLTRPQDWPVSERRKAEL